MTDAFFTEVRRDVFQPSVHTMGPWDPNAQHAGPPCALLGRAIERVEGGDGKVVVRIVFDILRPIPLTELSVTSALVRPGRKVDLVEATLSDGEHDVMRAAAWRMRTKHLDLPATARETPPPPEEGEPLELFPSPSEDGDDFYLTAMEIIGVKGSFWEPGPATAWFKPRYPLVEGEDISPLCSVLIAVDSASGISAEKDPSEWLFINTDLSVYLHRYPEDGWVCIEAESTLDPEGIGLTSAHIFGRGGPIGRSSQALFVDRR